MQIVLTMILMRFATYTKHYFIIYYIILLLLLYYIYWLRKYMYVFIRIEKCDKWNNQPILEKAVRYREGSYIYSILVPF